MSKAVTSIGAIENPVNHEEVYVHEVYEQIASHFSSTRYKVETSCQILVSATYLRRSSLL